MLTVVELRFTVSRMERITVRDDEKGLVFYRMLLRKKSDEVVTDRLVVSDEGVRVLDIRR